MGAEVPRLCRTTGFRNRPESSSGPVPAGIVSFYLRFASLKTFTFFQDFFACIKYSIPPGLFKDIFKKITIFQRNLSPRKKAKTKQAAATENFATACRMRNSFI
jgi:hypothetical protein